MWGFSKITCHRCGQTVTVMEVTKFGDTEARWLRLEDCGCTQAGEYLDLLLDGE